MHKKCTLFVENDSTYKALLCVNTRFVEKMDQKHIKVTLLCT